MQALVPSSPSAAWWVTTTGGTDDELQEVSITVESEAGRGRSNLRTAKRVGARLGPRGSVHGQVDDWSTIAAHAITSLLLGEIPTEMGRERTLAAMTEANAQADALAADWKAWAVTPLNVAEVDYALWTRDVPGGVVAHADLGWSTVEMWGTDTLPAGPFHLIDGPFQVSDVPA